MSTPAEPEPSAQGRSHLLAKALAEGPTTSEDISAMLRNPDVEAHFRAGYALLIVRYAELFPPDLVEDANQALPQALATFLLFDLEHDTHAIGYRLKRHMESAVPEVIILQRFARADRERLLQIMLEGKLPV